MIGSKKAGHAESIFRQLGYLLNLRRRPVAFRTCLATGLAFSFDAVNLSLKHNLSSHLRPTQE